MQNSHMILGDTHFELDLREQDALRCRPPLPEGVVAPEKVSLYDDAALGGLQQLLVERIAAKNSHLDRIQRMADRGHTGQTTTISQTVQEDVRLLQDAFMEVEMFMDPTWASTMEGIANDGI